MTRTYYTSFVLLILMITFTASAQGDGIIQILVDKKPVDLVETQSAILSDEVFVPVRQFAELAGATVDFDSSTGTLKVTSPKGTGVMKIGSHYGRINGDRVFFPNAPYFYGRQSYGPMLFFNDMWDQAWYWDPFYQQFKWIPIFPRYRGVARPPMFIPGPGRSSSENRPNAQPTQPYGTGSTVRPLPSDANPRIVVQVANKPVTYSVAPNAVILRGSAGTQAKAVPLSQIRPGDKITFQRNSKGTITLIRAQYKQVAGTVKSIGVGSITLESGTTLRIGTQTRIFLPDNTMGVTEDVRIGDVVTASIDPDTSNAYVIQVQPRVTPAQPGMGGQIAVNSWGPLNTGDIFVIRFTDSPGGKAWFTIPGAAANVAMVETIPGVYEGSYIIQQGDQTLREPVKVIFNAADGTTYTRLSARPVTIHTLASYKPRITSPRQGQQILSPLVVTGEARPGSIVRVIIEFRRNAQGILPLQGVTAVQDVRTDDDGHWQTPPLAAVAPFSDANPPPPADFGVFSDIYEWRNRERPTVWTITAATIGSHGEELAAYSVDVLKSPAQTIGGLMPALVEPKTILAG